MCNIQDITGGPSGPTSAEKTQQQQTSSLASTLDANYTKAFGDQLDTLNMLKSTIQRIQSGDTGQGFGAAENAARTSDIINNSEAGARNQIQAERNASAGQIFGGASDSSGLARSSAVNRQLTEEALAGGERTKADLLARNTAANYAQGRVNANTTAGGLEALSGQQGRIAESSMTGGLTAGQQSFTEAEKLHAEQDAASGGFGKLLGFGAGLAGKFITGGMGGLGPGGEGNTNVSDFFKGGIGALAGG